MQTLSIIVLVKKMAAMLSHSMIGCCIQFGWKRWGKNLETSWIVSNINFISFAASLADINSASIGETAIQVCFMTRHWIGLLFSRIIWLDYDFWSSRWFVQDASTYVTICKGGSDGWSFSPSLEVFPYVFRQSDIYSAPSALVNVSCRREWVKQKKK